MTSIKKDYNQEAKNIINSDVFCCHSSLVELLLNKEIFGWAHDEANKQDPLQIQEPSLSSIRFLPYLLRLG